MPSRRQSLETGPRYRAMAGPSDPAPLGGAAAVVWEWRHVGDGADLEAGRLQRILDEERAKAAQDSLTGVWNRGAFDKRLVQVNNTLGVMRALNIDVSASGRLFGTEVTGKMGFAMEIILAPIIQSMLEKRTD